MTFDLPACTWISLIAYIKVEGRYPKNFGKFFENQPSRTNLVIQDVFSISFECYAFIRYCPRFLIFEYVNTCIGKWSLNENWAFLHYGGCDYGECDYGGLYGECEYGGCDYGECECGGCEYGEWDYGECDPNPNPYHTLTLTHTIPKPYPNPYPNPYPSPFPNPYPNP